MAQHFYLILLKSCLSSQASAHDIRAALHPRAILRPKQVAPEDVMKFLTKEVSAWDESEETKPPSFYDSRGCINFPLKLRFRNVLEKIDHKLLRKGFR